MHRKVTITGIAALLVLCGPSLAQQKSNALRRLTIAEVMTSSEMEQTGVATLTQSQRKALDDWLNRYTRRVAKIALSVKATARQGSSADARSPCTPPVESQIDGDFEGWSGSTIFKLTNGQIWEQAEYDYDYEYDYMPSVTIYEADDGCTLKVEGMDETILVRRIK